MDCADEVAILRREIEPIVKAPARLSFDVHLSAKNVDQGDPAVTEAGLVAAVARTGMRAEVWQDEKPTSSDMSFWQRRGRTVLMVASGLLTIAAFGLHASVGGLAGAVGSEGTGLTESQAPLPAIVMYLAAILSGGWYVAPRALAAILRLRPDMNLLMAIAVIGAAAIGEWFEAATVTFLFAFSLALESWSVNRARRAVEALMAIAPPTARLLAPDGSTNEVKAADVTVGARILVKPGDRIPLDGTVRRGTSHVNQAPITGESMPVEKAPPADVFAGTVNGDGALEVEVTRLVGETTLAQIIRMVEEAQSRRAPSEQWVDRFARVYMPVILGVAILIAVVPPLLFGADSGEWFYRGGR